MDSKILFSYPPEKIRKISATAKQYSKTFTAESSGQTVQLNAVIYTLKPNSIFYYAKVTFFFILIATVISILILIFVKGEEEQAQSVQEEISVEEMEVEESEAEETESEEIEDEDGAVAIKKTDNYMTGWGSYYLLAYYYIQFDDANR